MHKTNYRLTILSNYVGIGLQAVSCNLIAILFVPLMKIYGFSYIDLGILTAINFFTQIIVDLGFSPLIDIIGYKKLTLMASTFSFLGLSLLFLAPVIFENVFLGFCIATVVFASASGLLEVIISPIVHAISSSDKGLSMSLVHSFYAWGQVITIIITTVFIFFFGAANWQYVVAFWAALPIVNFFMYLKSPMPKNIRAEHRKKSSKIFMTPFFIVSLFAIFFGAAAEVTMNQWTSSFMENALRLPKITGDLFGMTGFAIALGLGRLLYGIYGNKLSINNALIYGSAYTAVCYIIVTISPFNILSVAACVISGFLSSLLWPGTLIITAERFPLSGAWMFAVLAGAGDMGASAGPYITGFIVNNSITSDLALKMSGFFNITVEQSALRIGVFSAFVFPLFAATCHYILKKMRINNQ